MGAFLGGFEELAFFADFFEVFLAVFLAVDFFWGDFLAGVLEAAFLVVFLAVFFTAFFAGDFLAADFLEADFFLAISLVGFQQSVCRLVGDLASMAIVIFEKNESGVRLQNGRILRERKHG